jgi:hypothetical protein
MRAASALAGDLGFGSQSSDWMDVSIAEMSKTGLHCSLRMSRQMEPSAYTFGWNTRVMNLTLGATLGYLPRHARTHANNDDDDDNNNNNNNHNGNNGNDDNNNTGGASGGRQGGDANQQSSRSKREGPKSGWERGRRRASNE